MGVSPWEVKWSQGDVSEEASEAGSFVGTLGQGSWNDLWSESGTGNLFVDGMHRLRPFYSWLYKVLGWLAWCTMPLASGNPKSYLSIIGSAGVLS